jgi:putative transposase
MSRIIHRVKQAGVYFVTTDTWERRQLFLQPEPAQIVTEQIVSCRDRGYYKLHAFVVMPEHLHVLFTPSGDTTLEKAVQMIKGGSAFAIRKQLNYTSPVWHAGYHDRWIRDLTEYRLRKQYIEQNPVKDGLAEKISEYAWGGASGKIQMDVSQYDEESFSG